MRYGAGLPAMIRKMSVEKFNEICLLVALLWLLISIPLGIVLRPTTPDFAQFYLAGRIVREGEWKALYPIPRLGSQDNPGLWMHSFPKPAWQLLRQVHRAPDDTRFMLPPPSALVFFPFSFLSYKQAFWGWTMILIWCVWGVAYSAGMLHRLIAGQPSRWEGALAILIAVSPMTSRAIRIANVSPPIALMVGLALTYLIRPNRDLAGAGAVLSGSLMKYATLVLAPLLVAMRRWRMLLWLMILGGVWIGLTLWIAGTEPFQEFFNVILPTLSRPSAFRGNQSLPGMLARMTGRPLAPGTSWALGVARLTTLSLILLLLFRLRPRDWLKPAIVCAGAAALISWLLIFSPIAWEHWPVFLCPVWGWMIWEAGAAPVRRVFFSLSLLLMYFPAGILQVKGVATFPILLPEPYNSSQLLGVILLLCLSSWRLSVRSPIAEEAL